MGELFSLPHLIFLLLIVPMFGAILVVPFWVIARRAGLNPALSLLAFIPVFGMIALYYIAFAQWPSLPGAGARWQSAQPPPAL
jgi:hypothetical protein